MNETYNLKKKYMKPKDPEAYANPVLVIEK